MQSEQDRRRDNGPGALHGSAERRVFVQCQMRPGFIVILRIQRKDPPQVLLTKDQHMIQAIAPEFEGRDKEAETASKVQGRRCRGEISLDNPPISELFGENREISVRPRMRGGAERTRTACQASG
jgi:hypothetical protein